MTTRPTIVDLADEHVEAAAGLLAARHEAQRRIEPGLDPAYEAPSAARAEIESVRAGDDGASGVVAVAGGRALGFLRGAPLDESWGPNVWIPPAGHAATEPELIRDLYAAAAERWVAEGRTSHYAIVPVTDVALVDAWFRLGFGHQHVHALREVPGQGEDGSSPGSRSALRAARTSTRSPRSTSTCPSTRPSRPSSRDSRSPRSRSPVPSGRTTSTTSGSRRSSRSATARSSAPRWAARSSCRRRTSLALHRGAAFLGFAAVFPEKRDGGAGRAVGEQVLARARDAGYAHVLTDWRMTNLTSSRRWPRLGFRPTFYRLFRAIA